MKRISGYRAPLAPRLARPEPSIRRALDSLPGSALQPWRAYELPGVDRHGPTILRSARQAIERITGVSVREAAAEVEPATGTVVQVFTTATLVQVFLLAGHIGGDGRSGSGSVVRE